MADGRDNKVGRVTAPAGHSQDPEREERARAVAEGRADIRAGRFVTPEEIDAWIDTVGTPNERPVPQSRKR